MHVVGVLSPELRYATLFSRDLIQRFAMLEALHRGLSRPMLAFALALQNDPTAESRLRDAFPYQRNLLARLVRLANNLPKSRSIDVEKKHDRLPNHTYARPITAAPEYLAAARQAIDQLGETAERSDLLRYAETILETMRQQPVDIS